MFKQRKNKTFNFQSRFSKENLINSSGKENTAGTKDFISKWKKEKGNTRKSKGGFSVKTLIFILILLLVCMYMLEKKYM